MMDRRRLLACGTAALLTRTSQVDAAGAAEPIDIGLGSAGRVIEALAVPATTRNARRIVLVAGLSGEGADSAAARAATEAYARQRLRAIELLAVPVANPDRSPLQFPPAGVAYRENAEAHVLWRWLLAQAPAAVLCATPAAGMSPVPVTSWGGSLEAVLAAGLAPPSEASLALSRRVARSPRGLAEHLAGHYGQEFENPWYIGALALVARLRLGEVAAVRTLAEPWVDGRRDSLARPNALVMAGHVVFSELYRHTGDARYLRAVRRVADLGFEADGRPREAMPYHDGYSDSVFMGTAIVAQAGALTGEGRYFDMADRHLRFMQRLDLRPDGLYRHRPEADVAWGRGNGFAAIGLALSLSEWPATHPGHRHALASYRGLMDRLLPWQTRDGLWRNVINHRGAFAEFSCTAMIGFALERGLRRGWIRGSRYRKATDLAWQAVNSRSGEDGGFIDVCDSTARFTTLQDYLQRPALLGPDARGGAMALLFATERM
ncbi:MAG: Unsaturated rhamnogalacturonyl hydrolase YesR [Pseudomonadota bacterium]